jgi:hypothetical protein
LINTNHSSKWVISFSVHVDDFHGRFLAVIDDNLLHDGRTFTWSERVGDHSINQLNLGPIVGGAFDRRHVHINDSYVHNQVFKPRGFDARLLVARLQLQGAKLVLEIETDVPRGVKSVDLTNHPRFVRG